jgi:ferritin-like metal-binding protein YciE
MKKKDLWKFDEQTEAGLLNKTEITSVFVNTLKEIYAVKASLLKFLPLVSEHATARTLKLAIMDSAIDVKAQLLRLNIVIAILKKEIDTMPRENPNDINLNHYLLSGLDEADPYKSDVSLLTHLIMLESVQITAFTMMEKMSHAFKNKVVRDLITNNLNDAIQNQTVFNQMLKNCLTDKD